MVEVQGVSKRYGSVEALRGVSLTAQKGACWVCSAKTARAKQRFSI